MKAPDENDAFIRGVLEDDPFDGEVVSLPLPPEKEAPGDEPRPTFRCTDIGNGKRLLHLYGRDLRYCPAMVGTGWLLWGGGRWVPDKKRLIREHAKTLAIDIRRDAARLAQQAVEAGTAEEREKLEGMAKSLESWARASESMGKVKSAIESASSEPPVSIDIDELDTDPWLFNARNGTIDLRTGQLRRHDRANLITDMAGTDYDPKAKCPTWEAFLHRVMNRDATLIAYLKRAVGYSLLGTCPEQVMFILYGAGRNGKSTFINAIRRSVGTYARGTPVETFLAKRDGAIPNDVAALATARLVSTSEPGEGKRLDESLVKQLTGGEPVTARFLNHEWFEYVPKYAIWMSTNHRPGIQGTDLGIWRRLQLVPFTVTIPESEIDPELDAKLRDEAPGILAWAVAGCLAWQREGLNPPAIVRAAVEDYRKDMDLVEQFIDECCTRTGDVSNTSLFYAFDQWRRRQGERERSHKWLTQQLKDKRFEQYTPSGQGKRWRGLSLVEDTHRARHPDSWHGHEN